jgi:hypothetical protein
MGCVSLVGFLWSIFKRMGFGTFYSGDINRVSKKRRPIFMLPEPLG